MSQEEFRRQMDIAASQVEKWPVWKQNILQDSLSPTVPVPRVPVDNSRSSEQRDTAQKRDE